MRPEHAALVVAWLAQEQPPPAHEWPALDAGGTLALAWALKAECHRVWNSAPQQAVRAARCLAQLAHSAHAGLEVQALSHWTAGLAALVGGDMAQALTALEQASADFEANGQPLFAAQAGVPQLIALSMLGRHDDAIAHASQISERLAEGGDLHTAGKVDLNRGSMLLRLDRYAASAASYRQAAVVFARAGDTEHSVMADIGLAATLSWQFEFGEAGRMLARARQRAMAHDLPVLEGLARGEIGQLALHRGDRSTALREFEAARQLLAGRAHPQRLIEADRALADAYLGVRLLPEARRLYAAVIDAAGKLQAPVEAAWARLQLAQCLVLMHQPLAADTELRLAHQSFAELGNSIGQARADLLLARAALARREAELALALAEAGSRVFGASQATGWRIESELIRAQALAALGRTEEAADGLARACEDADKAGALPQQPWCELARAELAEQRGDLAEALRHHECAAALFEHLRALLPPGELRIASALDAEKAADALVRLTPPDDAALLLQRMERARARSLHDRWRSEGHAPSAAVPGVSTADPGLPGSITAGPARPAGHGEATPSTDDPLRTRLNWLYRQWQNALLAGQPQARRAADLLAQVQVAESAWQDRQRQRALGPAAADAPDSGSGSGSGSGFEPAVTPGTAASGGPLAAETRLDVPALQRALGPRRAMLIFHLDGERWRACVVRPNGLHCLAGEAPGLAERLQQLRFQLATMRQPGASRQRHAAQLLARTRQLLARLHADLLGPLRESLGPLEQLVIVPHRELHGLPWAALEDPSGRSLLHEFELVMTPSATTWLHCHQRAAGDAAAVSAADGAPGSRLALVVGVGGSTLPAVEREVQQVCEALGEPALALTGEAATLANLRARAPNAHTLHLACHASCRADNPDFSALHLADGVLTQADASAMALRASLVTLSACDTAVSRIAPGDEVLGLARGFLLAGASAVVATLWSVEDGSTAELMGHFYRARCQGLGVATALRQAQLAGAARQPHPFFWAPFVAYGHA